MTQVKIRHPKFEVLLKKNVGRSSVATGVPISERFRGQAAVIDLAPYLGDQGSVQVNKSVREAAGSFSVTLTDMLNEQGKDSIYGLCEPHDLIEIRMLSDGHLFWETGQVPIMMRGFISEVTRTLGMSSDGKPVRQVTVTGLDYGLIWQIYQMINMPNLPANAEGGNLLSAFPFFAQYGGQMSAMPAEQFVTEVFHFLINPYINRMRTNGTSTSATSPLLDIQLDVQAVDGNVMPFGLGGWTGGTMHSLLLMYCDVGAFNELFIEDRESGPFVVYRPNPFIAANGTDFISTKPEHAPLFVEIDLSDVVQLTASRSSQNISNYYWVSAPRVDFNYPEIQRAAAYQGDPNSFYVQDYGNVSPNLYGVRKMEETTSQGSRKESNTGNGTPAGEPRTRDGMSAGEWITKRRVQLIEQNKDNVVFEHGTMRLKGNHLIRAGVYVRLFHGDMISHFYVVAASHTFSPYGTYFTTVQFERGTGFIDRVKHNAPYYSELVQGKK